MASLSDFIESYLKLLLANVSGSWVEVQRRELSERFRCAPSQINYVLDTRFSVQRGYLVETRRGGGGYIRIFKLGLDEDDCAMKMVNETIGEAIDHKTAEDLISRLEDMGTLSQQEAAMVRAAVSCNVKHEDPDTEKVIRARVLRAVLSFILTQPQMA